MHHTASDSSHCIIFYLVQVTDECVKKCGRRFQDEVGKFRFLNEMIKMISPKVCHKLNMVPYPFYALRTLMKYFGFNELLDSLIVCIDNHHSMSC